LGSGVDVVSEGELRRALAAGIPASKIMFSGVGKTAREMDAALAADIYCFNIESEPELEVLNARALAMGKVAPISFRINPDVDAKTHAKISTGKKEDKFGISWQRAQRGLPPRRKPRRCPGHRHRHAYRQPDHRPAALRRRPEADGRAYRHLLRADGHTIDHFDIGGGLGVPYRDDNATPPDPDAYGNMVKARLRDLGCKVILEPGRLIVANAGVLVSEVIFIKDGGDKTFVIVDAAMNDLIRPTLYEAWHEIRPVKLSAASAPRIRADIVGPVCESGDYIAKDREMSSLRAGDLIAIGSAGAYGAVQSGTYNTRLLVPEVLVNGDQFHVVRPRPSYDDLIGLDSLPAWLD
jgi:diaminopimelate decarboxylase